MLTRRLILSLDPITRSWAVVTGGSVARLALGFVASILIARSLGPVDFGLYAVLATVANIASAMADLGLTEAAVKRMAAAWGDQLNRSRSRDRAFFWLRACFLNIETWFLITV